MADHSVNALRAAARAMEEVVLPALDKSHPLAMEQATLVTRYLRFFEQRLDYGHDRNRFELVHYTQLAESLADDARAVSAAIGQALDAAVARSRALLEQPAARQSLLRATTDELSGILCALVRTVADLDDPARCERVEQHVLRASKALLDMQRAWFLPQGWEPNPAAVLPLEALLKLADAPSGR